MPAGNKRPCDGNPTVATNIQSTIRLRKSQTVSRLFGADGLLLFIPEHIENLNENPENRNEPENFLKYMYHLPEIESPRVIPASFRYSREVRRPSFTVSCLQFESWKALGFHSSYYTKFAAISQRIALYFEAFREILQRCRRGVIHMMAPLLFRQTPLFARLPSTANGSHTTNPAERRRENLFDASTRRGYNGIAIELRVFECNSYIGSRLVIDRRLPYFFLQRNAGKGNREPLQRASFQHKPANQISKTALSRSSQRIREIQGRAAFPSSRCRNPVSSLVLSFQ